MRSAALLLFACACALPPEPPPSAVAAAADLVRAETPPLYRKLYDYAFLPEVQAVEQRVRLRIWLRYMNFDRYQLGQLEELAGFARREFDAVHARHAEIVGSYEPLVGAVWAELDAAQSAGATEDELAKIAEKLDSVDRRETELLELRSSSVRAILDQEQTFLSTLTPKQDTYFADAIFVLRHRLDPWSNPGDFHELVGTVYVAGEFGTLTRPTYDPEEDHLNIGGLWSPEPEKLAGPYFQDARRDVLLYMLLLEPTLPEAVAAVKAERAKAQPTEPALPEPGAPGAPPPAGVPTPAPPGTPPPPGSPPPPEGTPGPGIPTPPPPAPPGG